MHSKDDAADFGTSQAQTGGTNENRMVRKQNGLFGRRKWVCRVTELSLGNGRRRGSSVNVVTAMVGLKSRPKRSNNTSLVWSMQMKFNSV
jgi:hypothetical protein